MIQQKLFVFFEEIVIEELADVVLLEGVFVAHFFFQNHIAVFIADVLQESFFTAQVVEFDQILFLDFVKAMKLVKIRKLNYLSIQGLTN